LPRDYSPEQFDEAISGDKLVMVDFYTTWCGPCKMMAPDIERVKQEMSDKVIVMKIDAEAYTDLSSRYRISGYPTVMFFKKGQTLRTLMGRQSYEELAMNVNMLQ
jgi:thioredoxin 1